MENGNFTYLALLLITIAFPLIKSFEEKIQFYKKLKYILPAIVITAIPFLVWDIIFEKHTIWSFSPNHTIGVNVLGLPIEEWLFFFIVPYACFFIYETMIYFTGKTTFRHIRHITLLLATLLLIIGLLSLHLSYTFITFLLASILLFIIANKQHIVSHLTSFFKGYLVSLVPFLIVNGILTKIPVVLYNNEENLNLRIYSIPIEDAIYLLSLLFINFSLYEIFRQYDRKRQSEPQDTDR